MRFKLFHKCVVKGTRRKFEAYMAISADHKTSRARHQDSDVMRMRGERRIAG